MKFFDKKTRNILDTDNTVNIEQYRKYPDRYETADKNGRFPTEEKRKRESEEKPE